MARFHIARSCYKVHVVSCRKSQTSMSFMTISHLYAPFPHMFSDLLRFRPVQRRADSSAISRVSTHRIPIVQVPAGSSNSRRMQSRKIAYSSPILSATALLDQAQHEKAVQPPFACAHSSDPPLLSFGARAEQEQRRNKFFSQRVSSNNLWPLASCAYARPSDVLLRWILLRYTPLSPHRARHAGV